MALFKILGHQWDIATRFPGAYVGLTTTTSSQARSVSPALLNKLGRIETSTQVRRLLGKPLYEVGCGST